MKSWVEINLPDSITSIGMWAFAYCDGLEKVTIPKGMTNLTTQSFVVCSNIKEVTLHSGITQISPVFFDGCTNITKFNLPADNQSFSLIGSTLYNKEQTKLIGSFTSNIEFPDTLKIIGENALSSFRVYSITLPNGITTIEKYAFSGSTISKVSLPDSLTTIADNAFYDCFNLYSITIPASVTSIGQEAIGYGKDSEDGKVENFKIYGYKGTAAENYANANSITFIALDKEEDTTKPAEPTTKPDEPTTKPDEPVSENTETLEPADDKVAVDDDTKTATVDAGMSVEDFAESIKNATITLKDKNGKELSDTDLVGTGTTVSIIDENGTIANEYTVIVHNDIDGNGKITAADARAALRGSAKLDIIDGVYSIAADFNGDGKITAADARLILRKSAKLD